MSAMVVSVDDAFKEIKKNTCKATQINNFPAKILKQSTDILLPTSVAYSVFK